MQPNVIMPKKIANIFSSGVQAICIRLNKA